MSRLDQIRDWVALGRSAGYRSRALARKSGSSPSQLRRFFQAAFGRPPQEWLDELRLWDAVRFLAAGRTVKETGYKTGFKSIPHFCRKFKEYHGVAPTEFHVRTHSCELQATPGQQDTIDHSTYLFPWDYAEMVLRHRLPLRNVRP
jgi:AraC-like DNA-binding protein